MSLRPSRWYLAQLKPGGLERARTNLSRQGFSHFMPERAATARRRGRLAAVQRPLFPGYLFVEIDVDAQGWRAINSTFGVAKLVALEGHEPTPVPAGLVEALRSRCDVDGMMVTAETFVAGDKIRIISGPFADEIAEIEQLPERDRVIVLLSMMGRVVRAAVSTGDLERA